MSTPFELLRRHKKVTLAAVTGIAVLSFIITDTSNNSNQMSPVSIAAMVIGSLAVVGWIWGAKDGKSGENAILGAVLGLAMTLVFMFMGRPAPIVYATSGNLAKSQFEEIGRQRSLANLMVSRVYYANPMNRMLAQFQPDRARPPLFGFNYQNETYDLLISELLNREASDLGIEVTDEAAMEYLKQAARSQFDQDSDKEQLTQEVYAEAIKQTAAGFQSELKPNEDEIIQAIRYELRAQRAANILLGGNRMTPADVWEMHRKLNTRQSAQFVGLPVADFIDKAAQPTAADLAKTLDEYKGNLPNFNSEGKPEEGRPSLFLQRRVRLAYVEPVYEEIEKLVGEITEEEIQARYEEQYKKQIPELPEGPVLPNVPKAPEQTPDPATPPAEKPADPAAPVGEKPAEPAAPEQGTPAPGEKPAEPAKPEEPKPEAAAPEAPAVPDKPAEPATKPEGSSFRPRSTQLQPVVLIQDQPAAEAEKPAEAAPAAEAPATEKPAAEAVPATPVAEGEKPAAPAAEGDKPADPATEKPAGDTPAEPATATGDKPAGEKPAGEKPAEAPLTVPAVEGKETDPAPPVSGVPPLTEERKQVIREELLREKMRPILEEKMNAARDVMNDLHLQVADYLDYQRVLKDPKAPKAELSKDALSPEEATKKLEEYAKKNGLRYDVTPLLTLEELLRSEDHPIGSAMTGMQSRVVDTLHKSQTDDLYSATTAFNLDLKGNYAFWKLEDIPAHQPKDLEEPGVKEMTTLVWRTLKARPLAEKRAKELADMISKSDKPITETLAEQTVTGAKDKSIFVTVKSSGEFSWLQRSLTPQQFGGDNSPHLSPIDGIQGAGPTFMAKAFNEMQPGDTAAVPNEDLSVFYVTHIDKRSPATEVEQEVMRKQFLESQGDLTVYAMRQSGSHDGQFADRLFVKHGVKMPDAEEKTDK